MKRKRLGAAIADRVLSLSHAMVCGVMLSLMTLAGAMLPMQAQAQSPYASAIWVNDQVITYFEIDQRVKMLRLFGTTGDLEDIARSQLIEDRLRQQAAKALGLSVSEENMAAGMNEFAGRAELTGEALLGIMAQAGIAPQTFRDFVAAGFLWREVVRAKFGRVAQISDAEIERLQALTAEDTALMIRFAEIMLDKQAMGTRASGLATDLSNNIRSEAAFTAAARRYSASPSAANGGLVPWVPASQLPPQLLGKILALSPGEVTAPVELGQAIGIFQLRGTRAQGSGNAADPVLDYVIVRLPSGRSLGDAEALIAAGDNCADLRANAKDFGLNLHQDYSAHRAELPRSDASALELLDPNEALARMGSTGAEVVMLCSRVTPLSTDAQDQLRQQLFNQRMENYGAGYLEELKRDAYIRYDGA